MRTYRRADLPGDLLAACIVTILLIPQSLAYAMLAGLPPQVGLYASILPLVAYALFGSSRTLAVGPVAVVSLMTAEALGEMAAPGTARYAGAAMALALLSGFFLLALGLMRLGFLASLLSHPVISGFISASAVLIALGQVKHILGVESSAGNALELIAELAQRAPQANAATLAVGMASLLFLVASGWFVAPLLERIGLARRAAELAAKAAPLGAVVLATVIVALLALHEKGVKIVGEVPPGLAPIAVPSLDPGLWVSLVPAAVLISLVGFVESASVATALAAKRRQKIDPNQELVGLGAANLAAGLAGGFPVTGGFARSVVNVSAGANTQAASVVTAGLIALTALWLTPGFHYLPHAVLAATIIAAVVRLIDLRALIEAWKYDRVDALSLVVTAAAVLLVGIEAGIAAGVAMSLAGHVWRTGRPHVAVLGQVAGTEHYRNVRRHAVITRPEVLAVRVDESLYFVNAPYLENRIAALVSEHPQAKHVVLLCSAVNAIDTSALETLGRLDHNLAAAGLKLHLAEVKGPVMDRLARTDFLSGLSGQVFLSLHAAMNELAPQDPNPGHQAS